MADALPPVKSGGQSYEPITRVSTLELFFDLVFVFAITQLTTVLVADPTGRGLIRLLLMFGVIWWIYGGYVWLSNAVASNRPVRRLLLLVGMAGFLVIALAIPAAFASSGAMFGFGYLLVTLVHAGLFTQSANTSSVKGIYWVAPFNVTAASLVLVAGLVPGSTRYVLWITALALLVSTPFLTRTGLFRIQPAHFVERHGLLVIIVLGESVVAIGFGAAGLPLDASLAGTAVLALALVAALWWTYFGGDAECAEQSLTAADVQQRPTLALAAFFYAHIPLLLGVIVMAAGVKAVVGHAAERLPAGAAMALAGGVALFLAGGGAFRRALRMGRIRYQAGTAALALGTVPLGLAVSGVVQLAVLVALVTALLVAEQFLDAPRKVIVH